MIKRLPISFHSPIWLAIAQPSRVSRPPIWPGRPIRRSEVKFKDLWNRPDVFRGRRVTVQGRVARIFRQGPVGSFPPLAEVWITSPAGDPFCVVFPAARSIDDMRRLAVIEPMDRSQAPRDADRADVMPELGRTVRFTGTF